MEKTSRKEKSYYLARLTALVAVFALFATCLVSLDGVVKVSAADATTVTIGEVSIDGTVGTEIKEQKIELTVSNGKFITELFYEGKDISDYFVLITNYSQSAGNFSTKYFFDDSNSSASYMSVYFKPLGLKVTITETSETKITCKVTGTPFSPSKVAIKAYFDKSMFKDASISTARVIASGTNANWNVASADDKYTSTAAIPLNGLSGLPDTIEGQAGVTNLDLEFSLSLFRSCFAIDMPEGTDVSDWYSGNRNANNTSNQLPVGVSVKVAKDIKAGDTECTLKLSGTPKYGNTNYFEPRIPGKYVIGSSKDGNTYWQSKMVDRGNVAKYKFGISKLDNEPVYLSLQNVETRVYAGYNYSASGDSSYGAPLSPRVYPIIYNGLFASDPKDAATTAPWRAADGYLYSNTLGNLDTEAPGFLYSPGGSTGAEGHISTYYMHSSDATWEAADRIYYLSLSGKPYNPGEYSLSYFIPTSYINNYAGSDEYTTPVIDRGKLVVMKPMQLEVDDIALDLRKGDIVNELITVKKSVYSLQSLKSGVTTETLKYTVSDALKAIGLNLTPVFVNTDFVVFKLSGTVVGKPVNLPLSDAVTLSYENFETGGEANVARYGEIKPNTNPDAVISIGTKGYGIAGNEIDYSEREPVMIYAKVQGTNTVSGGAINLSGIDGPTLETDVAYKCYSTDGGQKWKEAKTALTAKQFASMVNKGMTFMIADKYDKKNKGPADDAIIYEFAEIVKQEKGPKFKIDYTTWADSTGESTGQFILIGVASDKTETNYTATLLRNTFEIGIISGKNLNEDGYGVWPVKGGLTIGAVEKSGTKEKVVKNVYYIRTAPYLGNDGKYVPAGKPVKVSVAGQQKAPNVKIDYKKEVLKGKENLSVSVADVLKVEKMSKEDAKTPIDISSYLQVGVQTEIKVWIAASDKKPASSIQTIHAAARATAVTSGAITFDSSKHTVKLGKDYEVYDETKGKWGGIPKIEGNVTLRIRRKADAKGGKETESYTAYAAGEEMKLVITYGEYTSGKSTKNGILSAEIQLNQ
ncbi:MAG: hypothetical protein J5824_10445 [Lachnospiraceae bacterium]|nr:hypothetical protein [Lachnospiraceae bacterium]